MEFKKQSGRKNLPQEQLRIHCVSVRLNDKELIKLDTVRGHYQRGEAMRMAALTRLPQPINVPQINLELSTNIGKSFGNLTTIATAMRRGEYVEVDKIKSALADLQLSLIVGNK